MSYLVLARKWRPRKFSELVGQEHVVRALGNALDSGRVHHAFLFTGTRGVGKTTIARIFAKSLNCETGVSAEPCGECSACREIDSGRFVDLLEIDAASRTKVDDTRDLLDNVVYAPTRGRYKVYLIDEVHMLSTHSFNALLKTLEEPPEHVKFLLATTDPQKLPVTVLSRCLQFNLKRLTEEQIAGQVQAILAAEQVPVEAGAIAPIARAADGSLRDALSLLDQAIAFGNGALNEADVRSMLGTVDRSQVTGLLEALAEGDGSALLAAVEALAAFALDYGAALDELATLLHRVQLLQLVPGSAGDDDDALARHASALAPEQVQLWYQMAITGRRDLPLAPTPRLGFEMALLRMLAFRPADAGPAAAAGGRSGASVGAALAATTSRTRHAGGHAASAAPGTGAAAALAPVQRAAAASPSADRARAGSTMPVATRAVDQERSTRPATEPTQPPGNAAAAPPGQRSAGAVLADNDDWLALLNRLDLRGPVRAVAADSVLLGYAEGTLRLALPEVLQHVCNDLLLRQFAEALAPALGAAPRIQLSALGAQPAQTLSARERSDRARRQQQAEESFLGDASVQRLIGEHGARPVPDSIRPFDEV